MTDLELRGSRTRLRPLASGDLSALAVIARQPGVQPWWTDTSEAGLSAALLDAPDTSSWAVIVDGAFAGAVSAYDVGWPPGASVGLAERST